MEPLLLPKAGLRVLFARLLGFVLSAKVVFVYRRSLKGTKPACKPASPKRGAISCQKIKKVGCSHGKGKKKEEHELILLFHYV